MPEKIVSKIKKSILPQWKACFISALVFGLVAHLYKITNWLPNWDSIVFRYDAQNMLSLGRWLLSAVCAVSSFYDLPLVAGLLAIVFHGLGAVCICRMFSVRKNTTAILIGALVATFPTVTSVMTYHYVADGYAFAFLLSCLAALLMTGEKPRYFAGLVLIALSCGIYQAYVTVTIMLLLLALVLELVYEKTPVKNVLLKCLRFFMTGAAGMILYYGVLTVLLKLTGTELLDYQGVSDAASFGAANIGESLYTVKESFVSYFFDLSQGVSLFFVLNSIVMILALAWYCLDVWKRRLPIGRFLLLLVCVGMLPVGASVLAFINGRIDYHNLMKMGFLVFYLFFILHYEGAEEKNTKGQTVKAWTVLGVTALLIFNQILIANITYHKLNMAYEKSYGMLIRIADRIEQTDGADECDSILVLGQPPESEDYSAVLPPDMTGTTDGYIIRADDENVGQSVLCSALNDYCGKNYRFLAGDEKREFLEKTDADSIGTWPEKDSVFAVDNVIVIKLGDERGN